MSQRRSWTAQVQPRQEDEALLALLRTAGQRRWNTVATLLADEHGVPGKTGKQCRDRWLNHLNPHLSKGVWTPEEEHVLFFYQHIFGNKWSYIAQFLPGRSDNAIKNQFYSTLRRCVRQFNKENPSQAVAGTTKEIAGRPETVEMLLNYVPTKVIDEELLKQHESQPIAQADSHGGSHLLQEARSVEVAHSAVKQEWHSEDHDDGQGAWVPPSDLALELNRITQGWSSSEDFQRYESRFYLAHLQDN